MPRVLPSQIVGLIEERFPWTAGMATPNVGRAQAGELAGVVDLCDALPAELLAMDARDYGEYVVAVATTRNAVIAWHTGDPRFIMNGSVVTVIRNALRTCPDAVPNPASAELLFITDAELRAALRIDASSTYRFLVEAEWKAATVLAGATLEALLLWALNQRDAAASGVTAAAAAALGLRVKPTLEQWELHQLLAVARRLDVVGPDTLAAGDLAKNFRNLIHPGRAQRLAEKCTRGTAYSAVGAMERVIDDLTQ